MQVRDQLKLAEFWRDRLPGFARGYCWRHVLQTLTVYRFCSIQAVNGGCTGSGFKQRDG